MTTLRRRANKNGANQLVKLKTLIILKSWRNSVRKRRLIECILLTRQRRKSGQLEWKWMLWLAWVYGCVADDARCQQSNQVTATRLPLSLNMSSSLHCCRSMEVGKMQLPVTTIILIWWYFRSAAPTNLTTTIDSFVFSFIDNNSLGSKPRQEDGQRIWIICRCR